MCFLRNNMERPIACLAMALVLLSSAQNSHIVCQLGFCDSTSNPGRSAEPAAARGRVCAHSHRCDSTPCESENPGDESTPGGRDQSCPCPSDCWCRQAPQPVDLPRSADGPVELTFQHGLQVDSGTLLAGDLNHSQKRAWATGMVECNDSVVLRCAQLCRFLI